MIESTAVGTGASPLTGTASALSLEVVAPARHLGAFAVVTLLIALGAMVAALQTPRIALTINRTGDGRVRLYGPDITVAAQTPLTFSEPGGSSQTFAAAAIADDADPRIGHAANVAHWRRLSTLARMLGSGNARLDVVDAQGRERRFAVAAAPRTLLSLGPYFWCAWITAVAALVAGLWIWTMRRRDWASRQFALMSIGIAVAALPIAIGGVTQLATPYARWVLAANATGSMLFGAGLMGMVMRFPLPLISPRWAGAGLLACLTVATVQAFELVAQAYQLSVIACMAIFAVMLCLLVVQVVAARRDPVARRAAILIAATTATTMTLVVAIAIMPIMLRIEQHLHTALIFPLLLIIHLGVAMAVTRARLVSFGDWTRAATITAGTTAVVVALDLALIVIAWVAVGPLLALAAATLSAIHVGLRDTMRRRRDARERARDRDLIRQITQLSLAIDHAQRQSLWQQALRTAFAPLDIAPGPDSGDTPQIADDGRGLHVPRTAATDPLILSHAESGYLRFDAHHVARATELCALVTSTARARDDYVRGVNEERLRIARDLHDDINARLITSLHRDDSEVMRQDVRDAMADIRSIVGNLAGDTRQLGDVLADCRHESFTRLAAAGIGIDWPVDTQVGALPDLLSSADSRHLTSIVRELVTNTIRHADACHVAIAIIVSPAADILTLRYADDGIGRSDGRCGHGLTNIKRRAETLGGHIAFGGPPGFLATMVIRRRDFTSPDEGMAAGSAAPLR